MEEVKNFLSSVKLHGSSIPARDVILLTDALKGLCIPDVALKTFFKYASSLTLRYPNGRQTRVAIFRLFARLQQSHPSAVQYCHVFTEDLEKFYTRNVPSQCYLRESIFALRCLAAILRECDNATSFDNIQGVLGSTAALLQGHFIASKPTVRAAFQRVANMVFGAAWLRAFCLKFATEQAPTPSLIAFSSLLIGFMNTNGLLVDFEEKTALLKHYLQTCFVTKEAASQMHLDSSQPMVQLLVDRQIFAAELLPIIKKAVLRSPEVALPAVSSCLVSLSVDLSQFSSELLEILCAHLRAESDSVRNGSASCICCLAGQVTDDQHFATLVKRFSGLLLGAEGKLTNSKHKQTLLVVCSKLVPSAPSDAMRRACAEQLGSALVTFAGLEAQESIAIDALCHLRICLPKIDASGLKPIVTALQDGLAKKQTPHLRLHYFWCLRSAFTSHPVAGAPIQHAPLKEALTRAAAAVKGAPGQQASPLVAQILAEALAPCELTLRMHSEGIANADLFDAAMAVCGGDGGSVPRAPLLLSDSLAKVIVAGQVFARCCLPSALAIVDSLLSDHPSMNNEPICSFLAQLAVCANYAEVRSHALRSVRRHLQGLTGLSVGCSLLAACNQLIAFPSNQSASVGTAEGSDSGADSTNGGGGFPLGSRDGLALQDLLTSFTDLGWLHDSVDTSLVKELPGLLLLPCHHASVRSHKLWRYLLANLFASPVRDASNCRVKEWEEATWHQVPVNVSEWVNRWFLPLFIPSGETQSPQPHHRRAIVTLVSACPQFADILSDHLIQFLNSSDLSAVTRREVCILRTPDGRVFDSAALDEAAEKLRLDLEGSDPDHATNIKRENRLYSYADQMSELELRRELAGKKGDTELQKRLSDALAAQLTVERQIREQLLPLDRRVGAAFQLVKWLAEAFACAGPTVAASTGSQDLLHRLADCIGVLLAYPLTADRAAATYEILATSSGWALPAEQAINGILYSRALFSICSPAWIATPTRPDWVDSNDSPLVDSALRALVDSKGNGQDKESAVFGEKPGGFAVALPLLRCVLLHSNGQSCRPARCQQALAAMGAHCLVTSADRIPLERLLPLLVGHLPAAREPLLLLCDRCGNRLTADCVVSLLGCVTGFADSLAVRTALECLAKADLAPAVVLSCSNQIITHIHLAKHHPDPDVAALGGAVWERHCDPLLTILKVSAADLADFNLRCLGSAIPPVREAAGGALAATALPAGDLLRRLMSLYAELAHRPPAELDQFGRLLRARPPDKWEARAAVALALERLMPSLSKHDTKQLFTGLVDSLLRDESVQVQAAMLKMGQKAVELHGDTCLSDLVVLFEKFLETAPATAALDSVRQGVVVLLGQLAHHLDPDTDQQRITRIFTRLLDTLSIPSQTVQEAVSACLPPLMPAMRKDKEIIVEKLMLQALESENYAQRKGAAYGLAGVTKGLGIAVLKEMQVNLRLLDAMKDKKNAHRREGALLSLEQICLVWGRLFEPYVVSILPSLLICCGDSISCVRQAADECSIAVMSKLSNHGVKLVLPSLLNTLAEDNWRTKCASVDLLGSMSYCAPKQLSSCLPQIVPKLMEVLTDSHVRVQKAGEDALAKIGKVITNQEIRGIVPFLLDAIRDPDGHTNNALQQLIGVQFVHKIDTASLALIMPVVGRAFRDPTTETRKTAALIVGNIYRLTERVDLTPYMENLLPGLKKCLLDPVPDVRAVAAKALGSMVREMGESSFQDLFPWLMRTLVSEDSPINRAGAAQGLAEMIGGMGSAKLESLMPELINTARQADIAPHVRDGYLLMFVYLPRVFQDEFSQYVSATLPAILSGLANEIEFVRETALKAGQTLVQQFSRMAISLLLPELEVGLFDDNWRIRYSSVQLLGDLLYKLSGASGKGTTVSANDDDTMGSNSEFARIGDQLGQERRNRVLAGLYVSRSDSALLVRQASCHVWKVVVPHTPRTLQAILPTLLPMLLCNLASNSADMREVSARTLGDIVRKLGERVLQHMMQMLQNGLDSDDAKQREGVCLALSEIMRSMPRDHMQAYADQLVPTVRRALADPLTSVRAAASRTFDQLYGVLGQRALEDVILRLQSDLESGAADPESALDGLKQAVSARSDVVLPYLVPRLTQEPVNIHTLAMLASVAGNALTPHLPRVLPALLGALNPDSTEQMAQCQAVMQGVRDEAGVQLAIRHLTSSELVNQSINYRLGAARLLQTLVQRDGSDLISDYTEAILRSCFRLYCIQDARVIAAAHDCLSSLVTGYLAPQELVTVIRTAVRHVLSEPQNRATITLVPGFCSVQPKGILPMLNVYREGLLSGQVEQKEAAALGLKELIERTSPEALKTSVVPITGPLIRVLGDRFAAQLKCAVIDALIALLARCGSAMKAFLPQLQLTLFKALADPAQSLRAKAALAIGELAGVHAKPDQMVTELLAALAKPDAFQATLLSALRQWCLRSGLALSPAACESVISVVRSSRLCSAEDETTRACAGACVGLLAAVCQRVADATLGSAAGQQYLTSAGPDNWQDWQARLGGLVAYLGVATSDDVNARLEVIETAALAAIDSDRPQVVDAGVRCIGQALAKTPQSERLIAGLVRAQKHESSDIKLQASLAVSLACEAQPDSALLEYLARPLLPMLANGTREKNSAVKAASEQAMADMCRLYRTDESERTAVACLERVDPSMRDSVQQIIDRLSRKQWQRVPVNLDRTITM